jgi:hypothetical protein
VAEFCFAQDFSRRAPKSVPTANVAQDMNVISQMCDRSYTLTLTCHTCFVGHGIQRLPPICSLVRDRRYDQQSDNRPQSHLHPCVLLGKALGKSSIQAVGRCLCDTKVVELNEENNGNGGNQEGCFERLARAVADFVMNSPAPNPMCPIILWNCANGSLEP